MSSPDVAVLVSTYQRPRHLERVLLSLRLQEGVAERMEVIVTDDGSQDETLELVQRFGRTAPFPVRLTTHPHRAFQLARCRNEGVAASTAPYLLFLDGDCLVPPDHVRQHLLHRRPRTVMAGYCCHFDQATTQRITADVIERGEYLDWAERKQLRKLAHLYWKSTFYNLIRHPGKPRLYGGNVGIWRSDYERINGYDEQFEGWGCEDDDLRMRLRCAGIRIASILRWTRTYHLWHPVDKSAPQRWRDGSNVSYLLRRGRLTCCISGLRKRRLHELAVRVLGQPVEQDLIRRVLQSVWPQATGACAAMLPLRPVQTGQAAEVEILVSPTGGRFSRRSQCKILVVLEDHAISARLLGRADIVVSAILLPNAMHHQIIPLLPADGQIKAA